MAVKSKISEIELDDSAFFNEFAKTTIDLNLAGVNGFLERFAETFSGKVNADGTFQDKTDKAEMYNDIKKVTYYNIKSLHEMMSGIVTTDQMGINVDNYISNPNGISKINVGNILNDFK